jgi:hypothetical protein
MTYPTRVKVATVLLVLIAGYNLGTLFKSSADELVRRQGDDEVTFHEKRFRALKPLLPENAIIGYVSDMPGNAREYYETRYVLSPVRVALQKDYELFVGNFRDPANIPLVAQQEKLTVERDLGDGVVLLRKKTR